MDIEKELKEMIWDFKGEKCDIAPSSSLDDLGLDSLDSVDLLMQIEEKYDVTFDDDFMAANFQELVAKVSDLVK